MSIAKYKILVEKSLEACLAAIEVYNKPNFKFREETFSILMLSAWEILLKARVMQEDGGKLRAIQVFERKKKRDERDCGHLSADGPGDGNSPCRTVRSGLAFLLH
ncbi:MAG: hypothetical protein OXC84_08690 [Gammaproteobacteria bacterium]|nr:hypothetical protein [Gammaproteobacteria bacterium]